MFSVSLERHLSKQLAAQTVEHSMTTLTHLVSSGKIKKSGNFLLSSKGFLKKNMCIYLHSIARGLSP